ncbi:MAG: hypothetical protein K2N34_09690 [Lachnospiraceae bacterium]|nr:hypothetical protein [Lachnospiraceae bacterium]
MTFLQNPNEETQADSDKESSVGYKGYIDFGDYIAYHSKQFFDELLTPVIKKQFDLRYDGSHTWYGPWENHMRKVITMFFLKGDSAIMEWGYNFQKHSLIWRAWQNGKNIRYPCMSEIRSN